MPETKKIITKTPQPTLYSPNLNNAKPKNKNPNRLTPRLSSRLPK